MKTILHITHTEIPDDSRIIKDIVAAKSSGFVVHGIGIKLSEDTKSTSVVLSNIHTLEIYSKKFLSLPKVLRHFFTAIEFYTKSIFLIRKIKPSMIHCHDTLALPIVAFYCLFSRCKLIYDAHELESDKNGLSRFGGKLVSIVERACWSQIDGFITVSKKINDWYMEKFGDKDSIVIYNTPSFEVKSNYDEYYLKDKFGIDRASKVFIYIGILGDGRGILQVLDLFKKQNDHHVVFLGYGPLLETVKEASKSFNNIHLHNSVAHEEVVPIASSADCGLCLLENISLSDYYALPNKLFEYAFAGIPVLSVDFPEINEVVTHYKTGICIKLDEINLETLDLVFQQEWSIDKNTLAAISWDKQETDLIEFYKKLMNRI